MRRLNKLPSVDNVAAGNQAVLNCPVGLTYDFIDLVYSGVTLAQLQNIEVVINGKTIQKFLNGTELDNLNQFYGRGAANGVLRLWFERPELSELRVRRLTSLGTADVQTLTVQMDIDGAAVDPAISAYAMLGAPQPLGLVTKVKAFPVTFATSGQQEIDNIPRSGASICAMHLFKADISNVEVESNSVKLLDATKTVSEDIQSKYGRTPITASATHVDFCVNGDPRQALNTKGMSDLRLRPTIDTPGAVRVVVEFIDGFAGI